MQTSNEVLVEFSDEFLNLCESFKTKILNLQSADRFIDTVNDLFRQIHSLKAISNYIKLDPLYQVLKVLEDVFQILRYRQKTIKPELLTWLLQINEQLLIWADSFEQGVFEIKGADQYLLNMIKISSVSSIKKSHSIKESTILLYTQQPAHIELFKKISPFYKELIIVNTLQNCHNALETMELDFIFISSEFGIKELKLLHHISTSKKFIPFIPILNDKEIELHKELRKFGMDIYLDTKITSKVLLNTLITQSKMVRESSWISFPSNDIMGIINDIKPLPEIVIKVQEIVASEKSSTRDVANLLEKDPLLTTKILQMINNPSYALKQKISTLHHAVSLLGKATIGALVLQENIQDQFSSFNLKIYGLEDQRDLYAIAKKRMDFIVRWYSKIDMGMLPILATTALLGNIGTFVIANAARKRQIENEFITLSKLNGSRVAELEFFNTTSEEISASIFEHWKLSHLISDTIRYSYNFDNAPMHIKPFALANFIVNTAIDYQTKGNDKQNINDLISFIKTMGFEEEKFLNAYNSAMEAN